ncbi:MAG: hypothetical protein JSU07_10540 [Bacteroidetes bacterium]|nr:hypothetical protein [Bacteroidota bacterium]
MLSIDEKDDLFRLIKSMSKSEKRYFKLFAANNGAKKLNYIELFEYIDDLPENSSKLKKVLLEKCPTFKYPSQTKAYLYELTLESLSMFHTGNEIDAKLYKNISYLKILHNKGLLDQHEKLLSKTKSLTRKYQRHLIAQELLDWEKISIESKLENYSSNLEKDINSIWSEERQLIKEKTEINNYKKLQIELNTLMLKIGIVRSQAQVRAYSKIVSDELLQNEPESFIAKFYYLETKAIYYFVIRDFEKSFNFNLTAHKLFQLNKPYLNENMLSYIATLGNLSNSAFQLQKHSESQQAIDELRTIYNQFLPKINNQKEIVSRAYNYYVLMQLRLYISLNHIDKAEKTIKEIENNKLASEQLIGKRHMLMVNFIISQVYFFKKDFRKALKYLNLTITDDFIAISPQVKHSTDIYRIILHYEMGNYSYVLSLLNSFKNSVLSDSSFYIFEKTILNFFNDRKKNIENIYLMKKDFAILYHELEKIIQNKFEKRPLDFFDYMMWLNNKQKR